MLSAMKKADWEAMSNKIKSAPEDPQVQYYGKVGILIGLFFWALILIIIPGLVTDGLGLMMLIFWATSPIVRNFDPGYEP